jgi:transcriptional regulator GlxA family with amidase domain
MTPDSRHNAAPRNVLSIVNYINTHLAKHLSLADLFVCLPLDVRESVPVFETFMGMSLQKYIQRRRVEGALQILQKDPDVAGVHVAREVGLRDFTELRELFLEVLFMSPRAYRSQVLISQRIRRAHGPIVPNARDS